MNLPRRRAASATLAILLLPGAALAADLTFSGALTRVGQQSISIRLDDHRIIDARLTNSGLLTAGKISAKYKMGDQVEVACKSIPQKWDDEMSRFQFLEVARLRFLRSPASGELADILAIHVPRGETNLLERPKPIAIDTRTPAADPKAAVDVSLERARDVNLKYFANLPNYVADESAKRYISNAKAPEWRPFDTIETEVTIKGNSAVRRGIRRNGKEFGGPLQALPGFKWSGGFGTELGPLFGPQCPTRITAQGREEVRGMQLRKYTFLSPPDACFNFFYMEYQRYNPARTGYVLIDDATGRMLQYSESASGFPDGFEFTQRDEDVTWDYVKIGEESHLLPVAASFVVFYASGERWRVDLEYKNHRHFESVSSVSFH